MPISYRSDLSKVSWDRISDLMVAVGWPERLPDELHQAFIRSSYRYFAYSQDELVGFGRTADDGQYYGMIVDLVVSPEYQHQGIGSTLLNKLSRDMRDYNIVSLMSAPGKEDFYLKQGWKQSKAAFHLSRQIRK